MYGFIVTTHHDNYQIIKKCLDLLFENIPTNSFVVLYINEAKGKVLNIKEDYLLELNRFDVIFINNQEKNGGLTGTWNQGIDYLLNKQDFNCEVITILGHDSYINDNITILLEEAKNAEKAKELKYFGPLCYSEKYTGINLWQDSKEYTKHKLEYLTGFLMTFPIHSLTKNKKKDMYFDHIKYPFAGNEVEWYQRFIKIGGKAILCKDCIINHEHNRSWLNIKFTGNKDGNKSGSDTEYDDIYNKIYYTNKIHELNFNWINYLKKNHDLKNKGINTEKSALNHYMTIGKIQKRTF